jgi:indolepyruvate ferredoxin oxidoreductase
MAAHLDGHAVTVLDMTGLAQKGGAVFSHIRIARAEIELHAVRIAAGDADLLLGCDLVVAASPESLAKLRNGKTRAVVNAHRTITGAFTRDPDLDFPAAEMQRQIVEATGGEAAELLDATSLATRLLGDSIGTNLFMLGFAYQKGLVPVSATAIERAIALNGTAVDFNRAAFAWGRRTALDRDGVERAAAPREAAPVVAVGLDAIVGRRVELLTAYQNAAYAARYERLVRRVETVERERTGRHGMAEAVARSLYRLMAYKDEYEVARLYSDGSFRRRVAAQFEGDYTLQFHLAPPLLAERDPRTGHLRKRIFGSWMLPLFAVLARLKFLRGTVFDIFGYSDERRGERRLIGEYEAVIDELLSRLDRDNHPLAVAIARLPEGIRGFGHIKEANLTTVKAEEMRLLAQFRAPSIGAAAAE